MYNGLILDCINSFLGLGWEVGGRCLHDEKLGTYTCVSHHKFPLIALNEYVQWSLYLLCHILFCY